MEIKSLQTELRVNSYPGRGIVIGRTADGKYAVAAYFIMGRSENSRNRIFVADGEGIRTQAFDPSKLRDPSLIIYAPVRVLGQTAIATNDDRTDAGFPKLRISNRSAMIVTNGDQTDTVYEGLAAGKGFAEALAAREFEPDAPNYTPRISSVIEYGKGAFSYQMSILKSADGDPSCCCRYAFSYGHPVAGEGRFLHTYRGDGDPLPSFDGEPVRISIGDEGIDSFAGSVWESLNEGNKVSLFVRYIEIATGKYESRILNQNGS